MQNNEGGAVQTIARFEIVYRQFLDKEGRVVAELAPLARDPKALLPLYREMVLTRVFDTKAIALQRTGRLGTYPPCIGQEAIGAGVASAMQPDDVLFPSYREQPAQFESAGKPPADFVKRIKIIDDNGGTIEIDEDMLLEAMQDFIPFLPRERLSRVLI